MKIVVIHGQNHKGSTYHITKLLVDRLAVSDAEVSEFQTNNIQSCIGCCNCLLKGEKMCPHKDEVQPIMEAIEAADIIIAESPNYCMGMSGQLKTFFDHMAYRWMSHRPHPSMKNKIGIAISTTAGAGANTVVKKIKQQFFWWGISKIYCMPERVAAMSWSQVKPKRILKIEAKVDKISKCVLRSVGRLKPGLKSKLLFNIMRMQQKGKAAWNATDKNHWKENGWI